MRPTLLMLQLSLVLILSVAGCGYKAPLYLPQDKPATAKRAPPSTPAPASSTQP